MLPFLFDYIREKGKGQNLGLKDTSTTIKQANKQINHPALGSCLFYVPAQLALASLNL